MVARIFRIRRTRESIGTAPDRAAGLHLRRVARQQHETAGGWPMQAFYIGVKLKSWQVADFAALTKD